MSGGSLAHSRIGLNTGSSLESALIAKGSACYVYNSDAAARVSETRYTYPDATVSCDERDRPTQDKTEVKAPRVIVEVLSDSTEAYDRGRKFILYRSCPTLQEYVIVATRYQAVEVYRRTSQGWTNYQFYGLGEEIELTSLGIYVAVSSLYRNSGVPETIEDPEGEF
jgi:Uma2 family endonuclease